MLNVVTKNKIPSIHLSIYMSYKITGTFVNFTIFVIILFINNGLAKIVTKSNGEGGTAAPQRRSLNDDKFSNITVHNSHEPNINSSTIADNREFAMEARKISSWPLNHFVRW